MMTSAQGKRTDELILLGGKALYTCGKYIFADMTTEVSCPGNFIWKECGMACNRTCDDPIPVCTRQCVQKCECPGDDVILGEENGQPECGPAEMCGDTGELVFPHY